MNKILNISDNPDFSFFDIKYITEELSCYDKNEFKDLSKINHKLFEKAVDLCISMFLFRKKQNKHYHSFDKVDLKSISIDEDNELIDDTDHLKIVSFFNNNLEHFYELASECFIKRTYSGNCNYELFFGKFKSPFSTGDIKVFLVKNNKDFYVIKNDNYNIDLITYLNEYGIKTSETLNNELKNILKNSTERFDIQDKLNNFFKKITKSINNFHDFQTGAITFLDFLGWKGLWQKDNTAPLEGVSRLIDKNKEKLNEITKDYIAHDDNIERVSELISISDTIAIFTPQILGICEKDLISIHSNTVRYILETSCKEGYAIRGAISYGEYSIKDNIMIGPGIDECASWHEKCDWIGVHLTPSAQFIIDDCNLPSNIKSYDNIPIKHGIPKVKYCVNWKITKEDFESLRKKSKAILPEIAAKYMNTYDFLFKTEGGY